MKKTKRAAKKTAEADPVVYKRPVVAVYSDGSMSSTFMDGTKESIRKEFISPGFASDVKFDSEAVALAPWLGR